MPSRVRFTAQKNLGGNFERMKAIQKKKLRPLSKTILKRILSRMAGSLMPTIACSQAIGWLGIPNLRIQGLKKWTSLEFVPSLNEGSLSNEQLEKRTVDPNLLKLLRNIAIYPFCIEQECLPSEIDLDNPARKERFEEWVHRLSIGLDSVRDFFERKNPKLGLIVQGYEIQSALIRHVCIERGIPILALENTALKDRFLWDNVSAITTNRNLSKNYFWRYEGFVDDLRAKEYCQQIIATTKQRKQAEHQSPGSITGLPFQNKKFALFLGQVYTDSSILYGLGNWDSPEQVIERFLDECRNRELNAVIKLHPKEMNGTAPITNKPYAQLTWRKLQSAPRLAESFLQADDVFVDLQNLTDTYELIMRSDLTVTITSQCGLEAAIRGKPSVVCGQAFYSSMGLTYDAASPNDFGRAFADAYDGKALEEKTVAAQKFAFVHFEKYCREKTPSSVFRLARAAMAGSDFWSECE